MLIINSQEIGPAPVATTQQTTRARQVVPATLLSQALLLVRQNNTIQWPLFTN